ncbi:Phosphofructokinase [Evansella caseinilytica]|uniref:6-phosphofructokinase n=1 Tax=Evansella caseinilytica TaxID=1503961 RepID=A0A1H3IM23_9BACI|nr:6-phosphofructokinase [Evansella caseinilytica]SDY28128.1 Phosphofructokinase [Evansella caseinilytica]
MKIGVINVGTFNGAVKQLLKTLGENMAERDSLTAVEFDAKRSTYICKQMTSSGAVHADRRSQQLLACTPYRNEKQLLRETVAAKKFDALVAIGNPADLMNIYYLLEDVTKVLCIPATIHNDVAGSDYTLGYDTAINAIIKAILQIADTAGSFVLKATRLFCIQIPGGKENALLKDVALAVGGIPVIDSDTAEGRETILKEIRAKVNRGDTYVLLIMNEENDPEEVVSRLSFTDPVDFRQIHIDEAQCMGPYPSALDRIIARKFALTALDWLAADKPSGIFSYQHRAATVRQLTAGEIHN